MAQHVSVRWVALLALCLSRAIAAQGTPVRPTLALMNFTNAALTNRADYDPLEWSLPEMLSYRLGNNPQIQLVDRIKLQAVMQEQNLSISGRVDPDEAVRVGRLLGARYMVFGTLLIDKRNRLRIDARVIEVETSKIVHTESFRDADWSEDVSSVIDSIADRLNRNLKLPGRIRFDRPGAGGQPIDSAGKKAAVTLPGVPAATAASTVASASTVQASTQAVKPTANMGALTMGIALRRQAERKQSTSTTITMLRTAVLETPTLAREVDEMVKKLGSGAP